MICIAEIHTMSSIHPFRVRAVQRSPAVSPMAGIELSSEVADGCEDGIGVPIGERHVAAVNGPEVCMMPAPPAPPYRPAGDESPLAQGWPLLKVLEITRMLTTSAIIRPRGPA
jgi:hypothetical protein